MFAPAAGWEGQNTVMIEITGGSKSKAFTALVETWGSTCVAMESGEQHDRVTAAVQTATHSALITFGLSLKKIGYDADMASKISTPPHRAMLSVIQRMATINEPDTYWDIQVNGPSSREPNGLQSSGNVCLRASHFCLDLPAVTLSPHPLPPHRPCMRCARRAWTLMGGVWRHAHKTRERASRLSPLAQTTRPAP